VGATAPAEVLRNFVKRRRLTSSTSSRTSLRMSGAHCGFDRGLVPQVVRSPAHRQGLSKGMPAASLCPSARSSAVHRSSRRAARSHDARDTRLVELRRDIAASSSLRFDSKSSVLQSKPLWRGARAYVAAVGLERVPEPPALRIVSVRWSAFRERSEGRKPRVGIPLGGVMSEWDEAPERAVGSSGRRRRRGRRWPSGRRAVRRWSPCPEAGHQAGPCSTGSPFGIYFHPCGITGQHRTGHLILPTPGNHLSAWLRRPGFHLLVQQFSAPSRAMVVLCILAANLSCSWRIRPQRLVARW